MLVDGLSYARAVQGLREEIWQRETRRIIKEYEERRILNLDIRANLTPAEIAEENHAQEHWYFCKKAYCKWHY
jgi:hypothetical protein